MANMTWNFSDVYKRVSEFLGMGSSPTGDDLTKVKNLVYRGYMAFLMPFNAETKETYVWEYLKKEATFQVTSGAWVYPLPDDYQKMIRRPSYGEEQKYPKLQSVQVSRIMDQRNNVGADSYPLEYAVRVRNFDPEIANQGKDLIFYPTPDSNYTMNYAYVFIPPKPVNDTDFFIGGPLESEAILESCLGAAELDQDEKPGVHANRATELIQQLILADQQDAPDTVGYIRDTNIHRISMFAYRQFEIPPTMQSAYGYDDVSG
jgi:hypothetical protein